MKLSGEPRLTRRLLLVGGALAAGTLRIRTAGAAPSGDGISHSAEAIHQEPIVNAQRHQVYQVLTQANRFDRLMALSDAVKSMAVKPTPAQITARAGGAFALFGGYISGRFIELIPDELLVQAWRVGDWNRGVFSIARFEFRTEGAGTKILFDHTGFPAGQAQPLAEGWYANYWRPLQMLLS